MGAWGYGPFDSDAAGDWTDRIASKIVRGLRIGRKAPETYYADVRAACATMLKLGSGIDKNGLAGAAIAFDVRDVKRAIDAHRIICQDERWIDSWFNPQTLRRALKLEQLALNDMLDTYERIERRKRWQTKHMKEPARAA